MSTFSKLLAFDFLFILLSCILYVLFGQITVRKLRNNPKTKNALGMEYASGWDIINVASALAMPRRLSRKLEKGPLSYLYANSDLLFENTNKFDQILGAVFYWLFMSSSFVCVLLMLLNYLGVFDGCKRPGNYV
ncbi:hypothetical protein SG34_033390 [Thalassomonas viridans]|uniref:Uncharacterized protein n=1 Tax=Thalassomonas viridans TaxID=137584 RepID=A0AAE9ZEF4_9GAMM|nr:hypothetical protein [Thalassomonas viridans]WDE08792.1 hypothetical protein SG34_033390 [Thalassomonas viridans]